MKLLALTFVFVGLTLPSLADETFCKYDTNGDKVVTFAELLRKKDLELTHARENLAEKDDSLKGDIDVDANERTIDFFASSEFRASDSSAELRFSPVELGIFVRDLISRLDTNADNAVSETEWEMEKRKQLEHSSTSVD